MKRLFLSLMLFGIVASSIAQKIEGRYTPSIGILGAANFSKFGISGNNTDEIDFKSKAGWTFGAWMAIPLDRVVSFEPQLLYSSYAYEYTGTSIGKTAYDLNYLSLPLLFKFHLGKVVAVTAGPQLDFSMGNSNKNGAATDKNYYSGTDFSLSGGLELFPRARVTLYGRYIAGLMNKDNAGADIKVRNQVFQAGLKLRLFGGKFIPADTDGDGIPNSKDKCPSVAGLERYEGCPIPDTDGDGINDEADKCPTVAGLAKYNGCPIPDTDKDGINDEADKCPTVAGLAKYGGCPIPDTDGDGINDELDKCPNVAGIEGNLGCPEMILYYKRAEANLSADDKLQLDKVVAFLNANPGLSIIIEGHTSTLGATDYNQKLSEKRAGNSVNYLISKGIDSSRLTSKGYGEQFPIGDNTKEEGRAQSRRTVIKIAQ